MAPQQTLREHPSQRVGEHQPHLGLPVALEGVDDAFHGLRGVHRVERPQDQLAGGGGGHGERHGLGIPHLAHQDHVGVLTQRAAQRLGEAGRVAPHFALGDQGLLVGVPVLDRVFDRQDVFPGIAVDVIDHRRQRARLAGPRRPGDQHQPARHLREPGHARRKP